MPLRPCARNIQQTQPKRQPTTCRNLVSENSEIRHVYHRRKSCANAQGRLIGVSKAKFNKRSHEHDATTVSYLCLAPDVFLHLLPERRISEHFQAITETYHFEHFVNSLELSSKKRIHELLYQSPNTAKVLPSTDHKSDSRRFKTRRAMNQQREQPEHE